MRVLVLHHTLNSCGGGERVALHVIKALMENGHEVVLGTVEKTNWDKVRRLMGVDLPKIPEEYSITGEIRKFGIYQRSLTALHVARFRKKFDLTINTHGDVMPLPVDITYLHFPVFALLAEEPWKYYAKYFKSVFWRAYFEPYRIMQKHLARFMFSRSLLLTNSSFSRDVIRRYIRSDALVVYPPVEVDDYLKVSKNLDREDAVISISRFSPEKNLHLIPFIAKQLPDISFYVIGSVRGSRSVEYYNRVLTLIKSMSLKNVKLYPNASYEKKLEILSRCKVFLHLMPYEHFGIAVVEGMASGCIPVVHKSGGQWLDIVREGRYGEGFNSLEPDEIAQTIDRAISKWDYEIVNTLTARASSFSSRNFREKFAQIIGAYVS